MQIICEYFPKEPLAYRWQAHSPEYCIYGVSTGYGSTKHHAIIALKRMLGAPEEDTFDREVDRSQRQMEHLFGWSEEDQS